MNQTVKKKSKMSLAFIVLRLCERSDKGKNVAVLCPMSLMVQGVGMKTNLSETNVTGFCIIT